MSNHATTEPWLTLHEACAIVGMSSGWIELHTRLGHITRRREERPVESSNKHTVFTQRRWVWVYNPADIRRAYTNSHVSNYRPPQP